MFYENFDALCTKSGKSKSEVTEAIGLTAKSCTGWKNGAVPRNGTLKKIADYFGITVEELMGTKKEPAGEGELKYAWSDMEEAYQNATPEVRAAAKAAAMAVLESGKK